jgi:hypothetical protein
MLWVLLLLLLLLFLLFKRRVSSFEGNNLYNGKKWANYRLGDVYTFSKNDNHYKIFDQHNVMYHTNEEYKGTIAYEYIKENVSGEAKNFEVLRKIIERKATDTHDYPNTLFLHIRIGDIVCQKDTWQGENAPMYYSKMGDTAWWDELVKYIHTNAITDVVIIAGAHFEKCMEQSKDYIVDRKNFLLQNVPGLHVKFRIGQSPDEDILLCVYTKHFISTGGNFGKLIDQLNKQIK